MLRLRTGTAIEARLPDKEQPKLLKPLNMPRSTQSQMCAVEKDKRVTTAVPRERRVTNLLAQNSEIAKSESRKTPEKDKASSERSSSAKRDKFVNRLTQNSEQDKQQINFLIRK